MKDNTSGLTLEDLVSQMEAGLTKSASEGSSDESNLPSFMRKGKEEDKDKDKSKDKDKGKGKDEDDKDSDEDGQTKSAALAAGADLVATILTKKANMNFSTSAAAAAGAEFARSFIKQAAAGDITTVDGLAPGFAGTKAQQAMAALAAESDATVNPMPTSDGLRPTGSMNQIFDAIVADAQAQGAASEDQVHETGISGHEGEQVDEMVPNQVKVAAVIDLMNQGLDFEKAAAEVEVAAARYEDELEKAAAVEWLTSQGVDFEDAAEMVKSAEEEIVFENVQLAKQAYLQELVEQGVDFDVAAQMVKQAAAGDITTVDGLTPGFAGTKAQQGMAALAAESDATVNPMPTSDGLRPTGSMNQIFDAIVADAQAQGAASEDQVHMTGISTQEGNIVDQGTPNQVKVANLANLVAQGVDFSEAVQMIKQASAVGEAKAAAQGLYRKGKDYAEGAYVAAKNKAGEAYTGARSALGRAGDRASGHYADLKDAGTAMVHPELYLTPDEAGQLVTATPTRTRMVAAGRMAKNPLVYGTAGAAALGAGGYALGREKKAAVDMLCARGVDFDDAVNAVNQKSYEMFGC